MWLDEVVFLMYDVYIRDTIFMWVKNMGKRGIKPIADGDEQIFKRAVSSQYESTLYNQLKRDGRLARFKVALQVCGARGMTLTQSCAYLTKLFPSYARGKGLMPKTLGSMISFYPDLEEAFGFCTDINSMKVYNRALVLAEEAESLSDIDQFNRMYDNGDMLYIRDEAKTEEEGVQDTSTEINFIINKTDTEKDG